MASPFNFYVPNYQSPMADGSQYGAYKTGAFSQDSDGPLAPPLEAAFDGETVPLDRRKRAAQYADPNDPGAVISGLIAEANANVRQPRPPSAVLGFVGPMVGKRGKLEEQALDDERRKYFYEALLERYGRPERRSIDTPYGQQATYGEEPEQWKSLPAPVVDGLRKYATDPVYRESIQTPYENTGFLGPGSALNTASTWLMALPQAAYAASEAGANAVADGGYRTAPSEVWNKLDKASETLYAPVSAAMGAPVGDVPSYFADQEEYRQNLNANLAIDPERDSRWAPSSTNTIEGMEFQKNLGNLGELSIGGDDGRELLNRYKAEELIGQPGVMATGMMMDAMLNPLPPDISSIIRSAKTGKGLDAFRQLLIEFGPDAGVLGAELMVQ